LEVVFCFFVFYIVSIHRFLSIVVREEDSYGDVVVFHVNVLVKVVAIVIVVVVHDRLFFLFLFSLLF